MDKFAIRPPEVNRVAKLLKSARFVTPLTPAEIEQYDQTTSGRPGKHVAMMPKTLTHIVRFHLGGTVRVFGYLEERQAAMRYADMAFLFFWKYRCRGGEEPRPSHFNFCMERARADFENETEFRSALETIEQVLVHNQILPTAEELVIKKDTPTRERRPTNALRIQKLSDEVLTTLNRLLDMNKQMQAAVNPGPLPQKVESIEVRLRDIDSKTDQVLADISTLARVLLKALGDPEVSPSRMTSTGVVPEVTQS